MKIRRSSDEAILVHALYTITGLGQNEIARKLRMPQSTVYDILNRVPYKWKQLALPSKAELTAIAGAFSVPTPIPHPVMLDIKASVDRLIRLTSARNSSMSTLAIKEEAQELSKLFSPYLEGQQANGKKATKQTRQRKRLVER